MILDDLATHLQAQGVGTVSVDIFKGQLPDQPDNCVALFEYGGEGMPLHWSGEFPSVQVRVRNKSYSTGRAKIEAVVTALHGLTEHIAGATRYLLLQAKQSPASIGRDQNNRQEFVVNFSVIKER